MSNIPKAIEEWAAQPHISARSVLVTIIGDTLIPVASSVWMSQMLALTEVFGFSDRLVRTSMTRLVNDGWLTNERVGRQSRYHFTELALRESAQADGRIYGIDEVDWTGEWTLLFLPQAAPAGSAARDIVEHLRWNGFVRIGNEVLASPTITPPDAAALCEAIAPGSNPAVAMTTFSDVEQLIEDGFFTADGDSAEIVDAYEQFIARHSTIDPTTASPIEAYALRTMLVHALRRVRLRWPDTLDAEPAIELAAKRYEKVGGAAAPLLSELLDVDYPTKMKARFGN